MARPVGDEHLARPGAAGGRNRCEPDPAPHPADRAEDAARRAVEGVGVGVRPRPTSPTNWIIASNEMVHVGSYVELGDGRTGLIVRVAPTAGRPMVHIDGTDAQEAIHPAHIARAIDLAGSPDITP